MAQITARSLLGYPVLMTIVWVSRHVQTLLQPGVFSGSLLRRKRIPRSVDHNVRWRHLLKRTCPVRGIFVAQHRVSATVEKAKGGKMRDQKYLLRAVIIFCSLGLGLWGCSSGTSSTGASTGSASRTGTVSGTGSGPVSASGTGSGSTTDPSSSTRRSTGSEYPAPGHRPEGTTGYGSSSGSSSETGGSSSCEATRSCLGRCAYNSRLNSNDFHNQTWGNCPTCSDPL